MAAALPRAANRARTAGSDARRAGISQSPRHRGRPREAVPGVSQMEASLTAQPPSVLSARLRQTGECDANMNTSGRPQGSGAPAAIASRDAHIMPKSRRASSMGRGGTLYTGEFKSDSVFYAGPAGKMCEPNAKIAARLPHILPITIILKANFLVTPNGQLRPDRRPQHHRGSARRAFMVVSVRECASHRPAPHGGEDGKPTMRGEAGDGSLHAACCHWRSHYLAEFTPGSSALPIGRPRAPL